MPKVKISGLDIDREVLNVLQSSGRSREIKDYPYLQKYMSDTGLYPYIIGYKHGFSHVSLLKIIKEELKGVEIFKETEYDYYNNKTIDSSMFFSLSTGYYMNVECGYTLASYYEIAQECDNVILGNEQYTCIAYVTILVPPKHSSLKNEIYERKLNKLIKKSYLKPNTTNSFIGMICQRDGSFYKKDFAIQNRYDLKDGDLHYGEGFNIFHKELLNKFKNNSKGLILFHGEPGTGKTYYIKILMNELMLLNKFVLYFPQNMISHITSPDMIEYICDIIAEQNENGKKCVILLEDAEMLLTSRHNIANMGISNLLNMTDGLLNEILNIQIIATFNTDLRNIDTALLRPERLIARKEFTKLSIENGQKLINKLKINKKIDREYSLAEIYSMVKENEIIIHEYKENKNKLGFNR